MGRRHETKQSFVCTNQRVQIDWDQINWSHVKHQVERIQQKIFRDAQTGNFRSVNQLQKLLVKSFFARLWAVRHITEISTGKFTPGIDGRLYRTAKQKMSLAESLKFKNYKPQPVKVRYIPKPKGGIRKLGIPTIQDRVMQKLVLLAMEPEWEAKFEPHSFGFRPGRNAIDAVSHIWNTLVHRKGCRIHPGWVFDADISNCFDNIDHGALLSKIEGSPFQRIVGAWLKSGAISQIGFERTERGTPQGGVISPLLANIALDGLERQFGLYWKTGSYKVSSRRKGYDKDLALYRYADDFIIIAPSREVLIKYVIPKVKSFLLTVGLNLNEAKTHIINVSEGFKFLGFEFRRFYRRDGSIKEFIYSPNRERLDRFLNQLKNYIRHCWNIDVKDLIKGLNRRIRGFCNYFKWSKAYKAFSYLSFRIWEILWQWAK
jgi:RNA-directed DNA polymerase